MKHFPAKRIQLAVIFSLVFVIAFSISHSFLIGCAIATVVIGIKLIASNWATNKRSWALFETLPEIIDNIISGVQSGLSLNEALINLETRGPELAREFFGEFRVSMNEGNSFEKSISRLQQQFSIRSADQLFEALVFAKNLGGSQLLALLRQLGDFTRQDLALRREIGAKQGWVKNSAHLSAGAPWILLLLLSAQPATSQAFSTPTGAIVLGTGLAMTIVAYLWMGHLSKMPEPKRIFGVLNGR